MDKEEIDDSLLFDLVKDTSFQGEIESPTASSTLTNPICGDAVTFHLLTDQHSRIQSIRFRTKGCFICKATAAALAKLADKKSIEEIKPVLSKFREEFVSGVPDSSGLSEFQILHELRSYPTRSKCVLLPFETLSGMLNKLKV